MRTITPTEVLASYNRIRPFLSPKQLQEFSSSIDGQNVPVFHIGKIIEIDRAIAQAKRANGNLTNDGTVQVHLHYEIQGCNYYIISLPPQMTSISNAYGYSIVNNDIVAAELGQVDIAEVLANGADLDLFWEPTNLQVIKRSHEISCNLFAKY